MPIDGDTLSTAITTLVDLFSSLAVNGMEWDFSSVAASQQTVQDLFSALQQFAFCEARGAGLQEADAHDCAMDLVLRALQQSPLVQASASVCVTRFILRFDLSPEQSIAWLRRCSAITPAIIGDASRLEQTRKRNVAMYTSATIVESLPLPRKVSRFAACFAVMCTPPPEDYRPMPASRLIAFICTKTAS